MGGPELASAGMQLDYDLRDTTSMGITDVAFRLPRILRTWHGLRELARRWRPDVALAVDLPDFNVPLAIRLRKLGIPVLGYIAPQFWAWRPGRLERLSLAYDHVACALPFESGPLRAAGVSATFVGHPLLDAKPPDRKEARGVLALDDERPCLALLPGSRPAEIGRHLGPMLEAAEGVRSRRGASVLLAVAPSIEDSIPLPSWCRAISTEDHLQPGALALAAADVALVASGTATLEAAISNTPQVALCRLDLSTYILARLVVRCRYFALPNLVLGRRAFPELLQWSASASNMEDHTVYALDHPSFAERQQRAGKEVRDRLSGEGAARATARILMELAGYR